MSALLSILIRPAGLPPVAHRPSPESLGRAASRSGYPVEPAARSRPCGRVSLAPPLAHARCALTLARRLAPLTAACTTAAACVGTIAGPAVRTADSGLRTTPCTSARKVFAVPPTPPAARLAQPPAVPTAPPTPLVSRSGLRVPALSCYLVLPILTLGSRAAVRDMFPQVRGGRCRSSAARAKCPACNGLQCAVAWLVRKRVDDALRRFVLTPHAARCGCALFALLACPCGQFRRPAPARRNRGPPPASPTRPGARRGRCRASQPGS